MVLSSRQRDDLDRSIVAYLEQRGLTDAAASIRSAAQLGEAPLDDKYHDLLVNKWNALMRLQQTVFQLERQLKQAEKGKAVLTTRCSTDIARLPRQPAALTLRRHRSAVTCLDFHPTFTMLASGSEDSTIQIWDFETGTPESSLRGHTDSVLSIQFSRDGVFLASSSADLSIKLWSVKEKFACVRNLQGHDHIVSAVVFTQAGDRVVSSSRDSTVKVWSVETGRCETTLRGHEEWVRDVATSPSDGSLIASASSDKTVRLWSMRTGGSLHVLRGHDHIVECVKFSTKTSDINMVGGGNEKYENGGAFVVSGSRDNTCRIWNVATAECILILSGSLNWVRDVVFHPSGRFVCSCADDRSIRFWDLTDTGLECHTIENAQSEFVSCLAINETAGILASGSVDSTICIWTPAAEQ